MNYRNIIVVITSVIVLIAITFIMYKQSVDKVAQLPDKIKTTVEDVTKLPPLPPTDESTLQKQLQEIIVKGIESECESLDDARYQFACHDLFKVQKR